MREAALWISGAALAFFVTAGAFLLLANLATEPSERSLRPDPKNAGSGPMLQLDLDKGQLASLRALPDQEFDLVVSNAGEEDLSNVNLTLEVSSENTALSDPHYYRQTVDELAAGGAVAVNFYLDLSFPESTTESNLAAAAVPEPPRKILEVRATTPQGVSAIKTVILPVRTGP